MSLFQIGEYYPPQEHIGRINRYKENKQLILGNHYDIFEKQYNRLTGTQRNMLYISVNLASLICKKSADFLFGETPVFSAGNNDNSNEQKALERIVNENDLNITNYESSLSNAYRGDSFYKIRWGQRYGGLIPESADPYRVFIEAQNAEYVFPETSPTDANTIIAYHIAYPVQVDGSSEEWVLNVESHYPGVIRYSKYRMNPFKFTSYENSVNEWKIYAEITDARREVNTGVPFPLVVHVPNFSLDDSWQGISDLDELRPMFDELNIRLSKIAEILDKHSDPAMAVPSGTLEEDENGLPIFRVAQNKVFEIMDKNEVIPQYITWNGQLDAAFREIEQLIDLILTTAEIPAVALGKDGSGTSGASGLSIKWRMNSLLAKINRKRQYYDKALKRALLIAQLLEHSRSDSRLDYEIVTPLIRFKDGLPDDELEQAQIAQIRTSGRATQSQLSAIMQLHDMTEEQARLELKRIRDEESSEMQVSSSVFNDETNTSNE